MPPASRKNNRLSERGIHLYLKKVNFTENNLSSEIFIKLYNLYLYRSFIKIHLTSKLNPNPNPNPQCKLLITLHDLHVFALKGLKNVHATITLARLLTAEQFRITNIQVTIRGQHCLRLLIVNY